MDKEIVIVRALGGEPLKRIVVETGDKLAYIVNPNRVDAIESGDSSAVGFPCEDVFAFDTTVFSELVTEYEAYKSTSAAAWEKLSLFRPKNTS